MFDKGFFGGLFDFDGNGNLDFFEQAADMAAFATMMEEDDEDSDNDSYYDYDDDDFTESSDSDFSLEDDDDFEGTGYSYNELKEMNDFDRFFAFNDVGLDVNDYDFDI